MSFTRAAAAAFFIGCFFLSSVTAFEFDGRLHHLIEDATFNTLYNKFSLTCMEDRAASWSSSSSFTLDHDDGLSFFQPLPLDVAPFLTAESYDKGHYRDKDDNLHSDYFETCPAVLPLPCWPELPTTTTTEPPPFLLSTFDASTEPDVSSFDANIVASPDYLSAEQGSDDSSLLLVYVLSLAVSVVVLYSTSCCFTFHDAEIDLAYKFVGYDDEEIPAWVLHDSLQACQMSSTEDTTEDDDDDAYDLMMSKREEELSCLPELTNKMHKEQVEAALTWLVSDDNDSAFQTSSWPFDTTHFADIMDDSNTMLWDLDDSEYFAWRKKKETNQALMAVTANGEDEKDKANESSSSADCGSVLVGTLSEEEASEENSAMSS